MCRFWVLSFLALLPACASAAPALQYGPAEVRLQGKIGSGKFQHPNGEWVEFFLLELPEPASIPADPDDPTNVAEEGIIEVQIFAPDADLQKLLETKAGEAATVEGTLFHAHTAWHVRPLVLNASEVE
jgi:hypothetical protein